MIASLIVAVFVFLVSVATYVLVIDWKKGKESKCQSFLRWVRDVIQLVFGL
jgi:hypothetical protein